MPSRRQRTGHGLYPEHPYLIHLLWTDSGRQGHLQQKATRMPSVPATSTPTESSRWCLARRAQISRTLISIGEQEACPELHSLKLWLWCERDQHLNSCLLTYTGMPPVAKKKIVSAEDQTFISLCLSVIAEDQHPECPLRFPLL